MLGRKLNEPAGFLVSSLNNLGSRKQANRIQKTRYKVCSPLGK